MEASGFLRRVMEERRRDVECARRRMPAAILEVEARQRRHHSFRATAGVRGDPRILAEFKRRSPSAGLLREGVQPQEIARLYQRGGAAAISVLTEPRYFGGSEEDLREIRAAVDLPILRKDFLVDPYQIVETAAWGADVVLLIVAGLSTDQIREMTATAAELGLDVLAEVHAASDVERATEIPGAWIGVNSRDLRTLRVEPTRFREMAEWLPKDRLWVAESGIRTRTEIQELQRLGYQAFLVGETLLRASDPASCLRELRGAETQRDLVA